VRGAELFGEGEADEVVDEFGAGFAVVLEGFGVGEPV